MKTWDEPPEPKDKRCRTAMFDSSYGCDVGHQGLFFDKEWEWYDVRRRPYAPVLGRFPTRDPLGYADGMSLYEYVGSAPTGRVDPEGLRKLEKYEECLLGLLYGKNTLSAAEVLEGRPSATRDSPLLRLVVNLALRGGYGITIANRMYFPKGQLDTTTPRGMSWLAHEMRHTDQYAAFGNSTWVYLNIYVWYIRHRGLLLGWKRAYLENPFENDARVFGACMYELIASSPSLVRYLAMKSPKLRSQCICFETTRNFGMYKNAVTACLNKAKKLKTEFESDAFSGKLEFEFYLKGKFTGPVGGRVHLERDDPARPPRDVPPLPYDY